jgi:hypothetical protein
MNGSYVDCPAEIPELRNRSRVIQQGDKIYVGANYVRCDLGATYCVFKIKNQTADICGAECLFLNYPYAGTMHEYCLILLALNLFFFN